MNSGFESIQKGLEEAIDFSRGNTRTANVRVVTCKQRLQKAKDLIKRFAKPNSSVVDELIAERREATKHE